MLVDLRTPVELAPLEFPSSAPHDLEHMQMMVTIIWCNACGARCNIMHEQEQPKYITLTNYFMNLYLAFLLI
jgi:succinate dehydrogenase/fumarate reductase-like Fe-S protein